MSLFHSHQWLKFDIHDASVFVVGRLLDEKEQFVVGSIDGFIWVLDPGQGNSGTLACLVEMTTEMPVLDIKIANFVAGVEQNLVAVLFPNKLVTFRLIREPSGHRLITLNEHSTPQLSFNMCVGNFGRASVAQLCIQGIDSSLTIFEAEHQLFTRNLKTALHPGPIVYANQSDSIITTAGGFLSAFRFTTLATASAGNYSKKLVADWRFNLGDWPLDVDTIDVAPVQPSILVLCKRTLLCLTHGGTLRFSIRLEYIAKSLLVYNSTSAAYVQFCIGTITRTILFYMDTILIWTSQLPVDPIQFKMCTVNSAYGPMIAVLSLSSISVIYLGTEPSFFRLPASQTRFINFEERFKEFQELETAIRKKPTTAESDGRENVADLSLDCTLIGISEQSNIAGEMPTSRLNVTIHAANASNVRLACETQFYTEATYMSFASISGSQTVPFTLQVKDTPITDLRCSFIAISSQSGDIATNEIILPLNLMCSSTNIQRNAKIKLTIESSENALSMNELFPDFDPLNANSIALQPFLSDMVISISSSQKTKKYRIQSDSLDFIYLFVEALKTRIKNKQPNATLSSAIPLDQILHILHHHVELERQKKDQLTVMEKLCALLRSAEACTLSKLKAERPTAVDHMEALMEHAQTQLSDCIEKMEKVSESLKKSSVSTAAAFNLLHLLVTFKDSALPLDGTIVHGCQSLWERIKWIVAPDVGADINLSELRSLLLNRCNNLVIRMEDISEESEEENETKETLTTLSSGSLPFTNTNT